jgi:hypothetical protein
MNRFMHSRYWSGLRVFERTGEGRASYVQTLFLTWLTLMLTVTISQRLIVNLDAFAFDVCASSERNYDICHLAARTGCTKMIISFEACHLPPAIDWPPLSQNKELLGTAIIQGLTTEPDNDVRTAGAAQIGLEHTNRQIRVVEDERGQ